MKSPTLKERIRTAYQRTQSYHELLYQVWPEDKYPRAHRRATQGGPSACAMPFGKALREMGGRRERHKVWIPKESP